MAGLSHGDALSFYTAQSQPPSHPMSFSGEDTSTSTSLLKSIMIEEIEDELNRDASYETILTANYLHFYIGHEELTG